MNDQLEQLNKQITDAENQYADLEIKLEEKKLILASKKNEQERLILARIDTSKIVAVIMELQIEIAGLQRTIKSLAKTLDDLRAGKGSELKSLALSKAQTVGAEAMNVAKETYLAFCELVEKTEILKNKAREYTITLKPLQREIPSQVRTGTIERRIIQPEYLVHRRDRLNRLWQELEKELFQFLKLFPQDIFADESLPTIDQLTKKLRSR